MAEVVAVERLRRLPRKERVRQHALDRRLVDLAGRGDAALVVLHLAGARSQKVVDQRIAGAGVEGDEIARRRR